MHAQRGKVIGFVVVVAVITKIARSQILGNAVGADCESKLIARKRGHARPGYEKGP